ncbi:MAG: cation transporter [Alphaproteobacteria bacterium]|nr:cation transporter [Alphaproteobacteria bacterium]MDE2337083.1 cation transporter [Alphaproteobacteria bacterium]
MARGKNPESAAAREKKRQRALKAVAAINGVMFVIESAAGYFARSTAMAADSLDMLGDSLGAGMGALVGKSTSRKQAWVALAKAGASALLGLGVLAAAMFLFFNPVMPVAATMGLVGGMAMAANAVCAALLYRYRNDNLNLRATWKCTRNDVVSNIGVLCAAALSHALVSPLPDLAVGLLVSGLFIKSSIDIAGEAIGVLRATGRKKPDNTAQAFAPKNAPESAPRLKKGLWRIFNRKAAALQEQKEPAVSVAAKPAAPANKAA